MSLNIRTFCFRKQLNAAFTDTHTKIFLRLMFVSSGQYLAQHRQPRDNQQVFFFFFSPQHQTNSQHANSSDLPLAPLTSGFSELFVALLFASWPPSQVQPTTHPENEAVADEKSLQAGYHRLRLKASRRWRHVGSFTKSQKRQKKSFLLSASTRKCWGGRTKKNLSEINP